MSIPKQFPIPHLPFVKRLNCVLGATYKILLSLQLQCTHQSGKFFGFSSVNINIFLNFHNVVLFLISLCAIQN